MQYLMTVGAMRFDNPQLLPMKKQFKIDIQEFNGKRNQEPKSLLDIQVSSVPDWILNAAPIYLVGQESFPMKSGGNLIVLMNTFELENKQHANSIIEKLNDEYAIAQ